MAFIPNTALVWPTIEQKEPNSRALPVFDKSDINITKEGPITVYSNNSDWPLYKDGAIERGIKKRIKTHHGIKICKIML